MQTNPIFDQGREMKYFVFLSIIISSISGFACPNFTGIYKGTCQVKNSKLGEFEKIIVIAILQNGCDKFIYNDLVLPSKYYTTDKPSLYFEGNSDLIKRLRKAYVYDDGKTIHLNETYTQKSEKYGDVVVSGTAIFKKIDDNTVSYNSERFDLLGDKLSTVVTCNELHSSK